MKKFLFTLAALLMAGSVYATVDVNKPNYLYVPEIEITEDMMNEYGEVEIPVAAHMEYAASAFQARILSVPEGLTLVDVFKGDSFTITYKNNRGRDAQSTSEIFIASVEDFGFFGAQAETGYYQPEGSTTWTPYGCVKWLAGEYENFVVLVFEVDKDAFQAGKIVMESTFSTTDEDERPEVECWYGMGEVWNTNEGGQITLEGQEVPPVQTEAPVINVTAGEDAYIFEAVGQGVVTLYCDGVEVENPYTVARTDADQIIKLSAVAHVEGQTDGTVVGEYLVPALEVVAPQDLGGEIVIGDPDENGNVAINYTGDEDVTIVVTVNGEVVEVVDGVVTVGEGESTIVVTVTAEGYNDLTGEKVVTYTVPQPEQTEAPVITTEDNGEAVVVTATGNGHICIYWDDQLMAEGEGTATWTIPYGEDPEGEEYGISATAQEEGKLVSDYALATVFVPGKAVVPETTAAPVITYVVNDENVVITATGEGEVKMYVDGVEVENPYTIARGDEAKVVVVTATAQGEGMLISDVATMEITIPAIEGGEPQDPHMTGYWVVLYDKDNNEIWEPLLNNNTLDPYQFVTNVALRYSIYGGKPLSPGMTDEDNPMVPFYIMIDGVRYACDGADVVPDFGNANNNPLYVNEDNCWNVPVGYFYTIGVLINPDNGDKYLQISKGIYTGIDEMNADKAVAGVRYFNMAGQEMQEANGMTIVVTTYTDGTTSAVKVMK